MASGKTPAGVIYCELRNSPLRETPPACLSPANPVGDCTQSGAREEFLSALNEFRNSHLFKLVRHFVAEAQVNVIKLTGIQGIAHLRVGKNHGKVSGNLLEVGT